MRAELPTYLARCPSLFGELLIPGDPVVLRLDSGFAFVQPAAHKLPLPSLFSGSGCFLFSFLQALLKRQLEFSVTVKMGVP